MDEKRVLSEELSLLRKIFDPGGWEPYIRHTDILSAPDPAGWEAIDFPLEVSLELTNHCNLRCVMCPVPNLKRKRGHMDEGTFKKVAEDVSKRSGFLFLPQGFGELLLHRRWPQFLEFARSRKIQPIIVLSNGMLLDEVAARKLIDTVHAIVVTIDGVTAKTYESLRINSNFDTVTGNIRRFLNIRGDTKGPRLVLRIIRMAETEGEIESFRTFWSEKIGRDDVVQVADYNDWAGSVSERGASKCKVQRERRPCRMLWKNLTVYHDGQVSPCCFDSEGELFVGDVSSRSLSDIWNGSLLRKLRDLHLRGEFASIPLCSKCRSWL